MCVLIDTRHRNELFGLDALIDCNSRPILVKAAIKVNAPCAILHQTLTRYAAFEPIFQASQDNAKIRYRPSKSQLTCLPFERGADLCRQVLSEKRFARAAVAFDR